MADYSADSANVRRSELPVPETPEMLIDIVRAGIREYQTLHNLTGLSVLQVNSCIKQLHDDFENMGAKVLEQVNDMSSRIDNLEKSLSDMLEETTRASGS
ncbi:hypothetical protein HDU85_001756 [Gaertneriomyces sp. JEL0708]|nr:hypothetical protein HDU85_001756 [Gaertneriomyces sp. JEL0708]